MDVDRLTKPTESSIRKQRAFAPPPADDVDSVGYPAGAEAPSFAVDAKDLFDRNFTVGGATSSEMKRASDDALEVLLGKQKQHQKKDVITVSKDTA